VLPFRRVVVVGATHGNELTGAWVARRIQELPELAARPSVPRIETVIGNPVAHKKTCRFIDVDLNRQFRSADLADLNLVGYERDRAKVLNAQIGPKDQPDLAADFIIDLHTTTTSMGISLISEQWSEVGVAAAVWCQQHLSRRTQDGELPPVRVLYERIEKDSSPFLTSVGREGLTIEVGPVPQGLLRHDVCSWMEAAVAAVMDFLEVLNTGTAVLPKTAKVFDYTGKKIPAPEDADGRPTALFHRKFQGRDFCALHKGEPIFMDLHGNELCYDGAHGEVIWPIFINEGGYYLPESGLGFGVAVQAEIQVPQVAVAADKSAVG